MDTPLKIALRETRRTARIMRKHLDVATSDQIQPVYPLAALARCARWLDAMSHNARSGHADVIGIMSRHVFETALVASYLATDKLDAFNRLSGESRWRRRQMQRDNAWENTVGAAEEDETTLRAPRVRSMCAMMTNRLREMGTVSPDAFEVAYTRIYHGESLLDSHATLDSLRPYIAQSTRGFVVSDVPRDIGMTESRLLISAMSASVAGEIVFESFERPADDFRELTSRLAKVAHEVDARLRE